MAIYTCENCDQQYCGDCTKAEEWTRFCSEECEMEKKQDEKDEN